MFKKFEQKISRLRINILALVNDIIDKKIVVSLTATGMSI
jgi:hypothetical protein